MTVVDQLRARFLRQPSPIAQGSHLDQLRARFGAPASTAPLPTDIPPAVALPAPSLVAPLLVRETLARWLYVVAYHRSEWTPVVQAAFQAIRSMNVAKLNPLDSASWFAIDAARWLAQQAILAVTQSASPALSDAYARKIGEWVKAWEYEYEQLGTMEARALDLAWQNVRFDQLVDDSADLAEKVGDKLDDKIPDLGAGLGFGAVVGVTALGALALVTLRPDIVAGAGADAAGRWGDAVETVRSRAQARGVAKQPRSR